MPLSQHTAPWVALVISILSIIVSISGWIVVHKFTLHRERANRRRSLLSFLAARKEEVRAYLGKPDEFSQRYSVLKVEFREQASLIEDDIPKGAKLRFGQLIDDIAVRDDHNRTAGVQRILNTIEETQTFVREAA